MSQKKSPYFELRSGSFDSLLFVVKTLDLDAIRSELVRRFEATPEFFGNDVVALDLRRLGGSEQVDLAALSGLLGEFRMRSIGVVATVEQSSWAAEAGMPLLEARDRRTSGARSEAEPAGGSGDAALADAQSELQSGTQSASPSQSQSVSQAPPIASNDTPEPAPGSVAERVSSSNVPTMVVDKPLRSGQQIYAKGDLVVLGLVSYGAEVIAEGNIHIYAPLRGRALAGVHGNLGARIFCTCLEPELVSIAGIYRTAEHALPPELLGQPVQVRLDHEKLIIEPLRLK